MTAPGAGREYSTEEIQRLLEQIRAEGKSTPISPLSAPINKASQRQPRPEVAVTRELSLDEILLKLEREIAEGNSARRA